MGEIKKHSVESKRKQLELERLRAIRTQKSEFQEKQSKANEVAQLKVEIARFVRDEASKSQLRKDEFFEFMEKLTKSAGAFDKLSSLGLNFDNPDPAQFNIEALMKALQSPSGGGGAATESSTNKK